MTDEANAMDGKQKVLLMLTLAAHGFFGAALAELEKKTPGRAQADRVLFEDGLAHVCISIQLNTKEIHAALALVDPKFVQVLSSYELALHGPIAAAFADPETLKIVDLAKLD
jgi:hypothetical protein